MSHHSNPKTLEVKRLSNKELRQKFNDGRFWERAKTGELSKVILSRHIPYSSNEPIGTESQIVSLRDSNDEEVARVHIYLRPDGTFGGSSKPDPKIVLEGNTLYIQEKKH